LYSGGLGGGETKQHYGGQCANGLPRVRAQLHQGKPAVLLGNTVNQVWNYGNLNIDDTTPAGNLGTHPDLQLSYRYSCDSSYANCSYEEVYDFMQGYGEVRWTYYTLQSGSYVQQSQTVLTNWSVAEAQLLIPCTMP